MTDTAGIAIRPFAEGDAGAQALFERFGFRERKCKVMWSKPLTVSG